MNDPSAEGPAANPPKFHDEMPDGCPPQSAELANGDFFRIVSNDPPAPEDFRTYFEEGKILEDRECDCHGLSVFRDPNHAASYADKYPALGEYIAKGTLQNHHGSVGDTPRRVKGEMISHATWWPFEGVERHALFAVVEEY